MPNQEQEREDKLSKLAETVAIYIGKKEKTVNEIFAELITFAKSPEVAAYYRTPVEVEKLKQEFERHITGESMESEDVPVGHRVIDIDDIMKLFDEIITPHLQPSGESEAWISVEDRLPEHKQRVLCFREKKFEMELDVMVLKFHKGDEYNKQEFNLGNGFEVTGVTHWQPLPAVPKTQTTK